LKTQFLGKYLDKDDARSNLGYCVMKNVVIYTSHLTTVKSETPQWSKNMTRIRQTKIYTELWGESLMQIGPWNIKGRGRV
jgi:hypothetical protein